jgi:hypothetical protein
MFNLLRKENLKVKTKPMFVPKILLATSQSILFIYAV